ncbi:hypothetical protein MUK42_31540, partial [Musa troglodytarum]
GRAAEGEATPTQRAQEGGAREHGAEEREEGVLGEDEGQVAGPPLGMDSCSGFVCGCRRCLVMQCSNRIPDGLDAVCMVQHCLL